MLRCTYTPTKLRDREPGTIVPLSKPPNYGGMVTALPKTEPRRNPALLAMAKGKPCLLMAVGACLGPDGSTTVACHSNQGRHGKGGARKADDHYTVWGCAVCHQWLDQGKAPKAEKTRTWGAAYILQLREWSRLMIGGTEAERKAAAWAIQQFERDTHA